MVLQWWYLRGEETQTRETSETCTHTADRRLDADEDFVLHKTRAIIKMNN